MKYPSTQWQEQPCTKAPNIPVIPKQGAAPQTVGSGNDFVAEATSGLISSADGSFATATGGNSESGYTSNQPSAYPNSFSLQLNSNTFSNTPLCSGAADPSQCLGWQQFVFSEANGGNGLVFIQDWLINYGTACPSNWQTDVLFGETDCFINGATINAPSEPASYIPFMSITGSTGNGTDTVIFEDSLQDILYSVAQNNLLNLDQNWTNAEFNVFGYDDGVEAEFSSGSTFVVQTSITNGTTNAPLCLGPQGAGTTGETNNLTLIPQTAPVCCPYGGSSPSIQFLESSASGAEGMCGASGVVVGGNFAATPYSINGTRTVITHPIIQGEIRVQYSATLEDATPGSTIIYQLFDNCGNSLESGSVSSGTPISYLQTEIDGQTCTYGIHSTMYATNPGYVQSLISSIAF